MKKKHIPSTSKHTQDQEPTTNDHQLSLVTQDHETLLTKCFIGKSIIGGPSWLGLMKRAFRSPTKERDIKSIRRREEAHEQEEEEKKRGKRRWIFRKPTCHETTLIHQNQDQADVATSKITSKGNLATIFLPENADHSKQKRTIADITGLTQPPIIVKQQRAILIIQTAFRGYLARKALGALKGLVKLQALIRGHNVRKRAKITLQCMQSLVRVQTQICDQRRRLSCERINCGSMIKEPKSILELHLSDKESTHSTNQASNEEDGYDHLHALKKVEVLLQKAKEAAKKRENTLAHAFSEKMWNSNEEDLRVFHGKSISRASCDQPRDDVKNIEIDTACSYSEPDTEFWRLHHQYYHDQQQKFYSSFAVNGLPMTPPFKMKNISASPRCKKEYKRTGANDNSFYAADQPNYMTATASAKARERSQSAPRQIPMTPEREKVRATKKRLSFSGQ